MLEFEVETEAEEISVEKPKKAIHTEKAKVFEADIVFTDAIFKKSQRVKIVSAKRNDNHGLLDEYYYIIENGKPRHLKHASNFTNIVESTKGN